MASMTDPTVHCAIKRHRCAWCWQHILPGEVYSRYRVFDGGEAETHKLHIECFGAMQDEAQEEGGWITWGRNRRRITASTEST